MTKIPNGMTHPVWYLLCRKGGWIFHQELGWLYIHPSSTNGFWCWDPIIRGGGRKQDVSSSNISIFTSILSIKTGWEVLILVVVNPASTNSSNQRILSQTKPNIVFTRIKFLIFFFCISIAGLHAHDRSQRRFLGQLLPVLPW